jgi:hypothetical protein
MVGMSIVHGSPQSIWVPVVPAGTIYVGGLVCVDTSGPLNGVIQLPDASGVANDSNLDVPFGVCIGTNRKNPLFNSTELTEYITAPAAADAFGGASIEYVGVEGPWAKGDPIPMVKIALIAPGTVIKAPLRVANIKTAPTVETVTSQTTGGATGVGCTTGTQDFTSIANDMQTLYFRSGGNAGTYRTNNSASATALLFAKATRNSVEIGDTLVIVPVRSHGFSTVMFDDTTAMFIDCADAPALNGTDRWIIQVVRLDLATPGQEYCEFCFDSVHFQHFSV